MPASSIVFNGATVRRPGVYTQYDTSALAGAGAAERGVVAIVGAWERGQPNVPFICSSAAQLKRALPDSGPQLASLLFNPSKDSRITRGATRVVVLRPDCAGDAVGRAALTMLDADSAASLVIRALTWGAYGSRITIAKAAGTLASTHKITVELDGTTEVHDNMGGSKAFTARYTGAEATTMTLAVTPGSDPRVVVAFTKTGMVAGAYAPDKMAFDGPLSFALAGGVAPVGGSTFAIVGTATDGSTGETVTILEGAAGPVASAKSYTSVATVTPANLPAGPATYTISGKAFSLALASYPTVQRVVDRINSKSAKGFSATVVTTLNASTFGLANLDTFPASDIVAAADGPKHDLYSIVTALNRDSSLIVAERSAAGVKPPATLSTTNLAGGSDGGVPVASDWEIALAALRTQFVQFVWVNSSDPAIHAKLAAHLTEMWGIGRDERQAFVGLVTDDTKTNVKSAIALLNSPYMTPLAQEIQVYDPDGVAVWLSPVYEALLATGMAAGRSAVGEPLTWKYPQVLAFRQDSTWSPDEDAEEMLAAGLMFLATDHLGARWERSITSYLQADNPILTEFSFVESVGASLKDLRRYLQALIGGNNADITAATLFGLASARLDRQKDPKDLALIRNWQTLAIEDLGDAYGLDYQVAPKEPVNFIQITAHVVRMPTTV